MGDPAGVGPELVLAAAANEDLRELCALHVVGSEEVLLRCAEALGGADVSAVFAGDANFHDVSLPRGAFSIGVPSEASGRAAAAYVERACALARGGEVDAICTAPIDKVALRAASCPHIDHTAMFAHAFGVADPLTLFVTGGLRIFFYSRHLSLGEAVRAVDAGRLSAFLKRASEELRRLGVFRPRLGVAALNPHAGDGGRFGQEENEHIAPAVADARGRGEDVIGPVSADAVFHQGREGRYDAVVALYHDQGHIAAKTLDFHGTIALTLGLPIPRTSVDHGTAMDIAWKGRVEPRSMILAVKAAAALVEGRLP